MAVAEKSAVREGRMAAGTTTDATATSGAGKHTWWHRLAHVSFVKRGPDHTNYNERQS